MLLSKKVDTIENKILNTHGLQVILDRDLATLYQTETRSLKQSVKRNTDKFLKDFMFELNNGGIEILVSQNVIPSNFF